MRTALIGLGRIGWQYHIREIVKHDGYTLCAVVDTNVERLKEAYETYGIPGYQDYHEMLRTETPELVVIASPTIYHEEQVLSALEMGIDVLVDKPLSLGLDSALRIQKAVTETQRKLVVYQPHRFTKLAVAAKQVLDCGKLGKVYCIRSNIHKYVRRSDWQAFRELGGGSLSNYGPHYIDKLLFLTGKKVVNMSCRMRKIASLGDAEDVVKLILETEDGTMLDIDINQATAMPASAMIIWGEYGTAWVEKDEKGESVFHLKYYVPEELDHLEASRELKAFGRKYAMESIPWKEDFISISQAEEKNFYDLSLKYFKEEAGSPVPLEETIEVMRIIEKCKEMGGAE